MPGPGREWIGKEEREAVLEVVESGHLFRYGRPEDPGFKAKVYTFEQELAAACGVKHAVATTSGSASLIAALLAAGIGPGDEVVVPAYTFVATYSSIIFCGAVPVLAEIDETLDLDPSDVEKRITPRTKAIMPVHMLGNPCDMAAILAIAAKHGLTVIEDACQAAGASYRGRRVGSLGRIGAFSLNVFKTITAGDGGAVVTDDTELYHRAFAIHDQGHLPLRTGVEVGTRSILGLNFRMNELTGAVALAQLRKLDAILATLRAKKARFKRLIGGIPGVRFRKLPDPDGECATLCTVIFDDAARAAAVAQRLGTTTVERSGWHVYANMEHVGRWLAEHGRPSGKGAYPRTDDLLSRAINLSVGVVDAGLGAAFGVHIRSTDEEIEAAARRFRAACGA
ncbi:MAG TPA: DegT/DnrJ/EryC1/StrS family aminotransferase [Vicinamibacteria bacterium]|nr:DegT/DnrJ/EryC1/StrS family aminotransferase [Vicinamibacteria bacterium]